MTKKGKQQLANQAYTIDEFCEAVRICRTTFYRLKQEKRLPPLKLINRKWLISIKDTEKWLDGLSNGL